MSDDAPLASSWCTNWAGFNTPRLWAMVSEEDNPDSWQQVAAWAQVAGVVKDHRAQLVRAREALAAAWPPETNQSADAFVNELDKLIKGLDTARADADTTATGLAGILDALRQAKDKIQPLYEEYRQKNDDWIPGWWDNAEDEIDRKARAHMIAAEQLVEQSVPQLRVPEPYVMDPAAKSAYVSDRTDRTSPTGGPGGSSGAVGTGRADAIIPVPHDPVPPLPGHQPSVSSPADTGAVSSGGIGLAGSAPPTVLPPGTTTVPPVIGGQTPAPSSGLIPPGPMPGVVPGQVPGVVPGQVPGVVPGQVPGVGGPVPGGIAGGRGPIGNLGDPGTLSAGAGGGYAGRVADAGRPGVRAATKPTPPSWLAEDRGASGRPAATANGAVGTTSAARRPASSEADQGRRFVPDNLWGVASGVEPVIAPSRGNPRHDPGPNVIGYHG